MEVGLRVDGEGGLRVDGEGGLTGREVRVDGEGGLGLRVDGEGGLTLLPRQPSTLNPRSLPVMCMYIYIHIMTLNPYLLVVLFLN